MFTKAIALKVLEMTQVVMHTPPFQHATRSPSSMLCNYRG